MMKQDSAEAVALKALAWLAGNDEEARALRQVDRSKKNKTWRVLHRVTYVERPALMNFGQDTREVMRNIERPKFFTEFGPLQESVSDLHESQADHRASRSPTDICPADRLAGRRAEVDRPWTRPASCRHPECKPTVI